MILLPVSSRSSDLLVADLGRLVVTNSFKYSGETDTISVVRDSSGESIHPRQKYIIYDLKPFCRQKMLVRCNVD